ncbi:MAG: carboxypeptidase regulatory-like domain-containing protein [Planctomycetota bacterium]|nr:MAG: carboxypeptidase regulatory-like domain-containing protein [Planctomycetota bacterium]
MKLPSLPKAPFRRSKAQEKNPEEASQKTSKSFPKKAILLILPVVLVPVGVLRWPGLIPGFGDSEKELPDYLKEAAAPEEEAAPVEAIEEGETGELPEIDLAILEGRVLPEGGGGGLAGLEVEVRLARTADSPMILTTDREGRFRLPLEHAAKVEEILVRPGPKSAASRLRPGLNLRPGMKRDLHLTVAPGASMNGRVVDESGEPLPEVEVLAWCRPLEQVENLPPDRRVTTNSLGQFELQGLGPEVFLRASAPGFAAVRQLTGVVESGDALEGLELVLAAGRPIRGWVVDENGEVVEGARVRAIPAEAPDDAAATGFPGLENAGEVMANGLTDAEGRFALVDMARCAYRLQVEHPEFTPWEGIHETDGADLEVSLKAGLKLEGVVLDGDDQPIANAWVALVGSGRREVWTDQEGKFRLAGLANWPNHELLVQAPGFAMELLSKIQPVVEGEALRLSLHPESVLAGQVTDLEAQPLSGLAVRIRGGRVSESHDLTWEEMHGLDLVKTDETGAFHFRGLYPGAYHLEVLDRDGQVLAELQKVPAGSTSLEVALDPSRLRLAFMQGAALDALSGEALSRLHLLVLSAEDPLQGSEFWIECQDGRFECPGLEPGTYFLEWSAPGFAPLVFASEVLEAGRLPLQLNFLPERNLPLRVEDRHGESLSGRVHFADPEGRPLTVRREPSLRGTWLPLDRRGEVFVRGLPATVIDGFVQIEGREGEWPFTVDLSSPLNQVFEVQLPISAPAPVVPMDLLFFGLQPGAEAPQAVMDAAGLQALQALPQVWPADAPLSLKIFRKEDGGEVISARLEPGEQGGFYWMRGERSGWDPLPRIPLQLPEEELVVELQAEGYGTWSLRLSAPFPAEGMQAVFMQNQVVEEAEVKEHTAVSNEEIGQ